MSINKKNVNVKNRLLSTPWLQKSIILLSVALIANHLTDIDNFPFSDTYKFPFIPILTTLLIGSLIILIADFNFNYFKKRFFIKHIDTNIILRFLATTLGYVMLLYIPAYYLVTWLMGDDYVLYDLLVGLSITLLLSCILIIAIYAKDIYQLHKFKTINDQLPIQRAGKTTLINYGDIAYFYSKDKVVYIVQTDGHTLASHFTLNEIADKINPHLFFRANRQTILHASSIKQVANIENGKIVVTLKPAMFNKAVIEIIVSRYKKQVFLKWFEHKL